jgi:hypothetical protein
MIPLSGRHAAALLALLAAALVPVALHSLGGSVRDDCADPAALLAPPALPGARAWRQRDRSQERIFQATEAAWEDPRRGHRLSLQLARSYDPAPLLLTPRIFVGAQNERYDLALEWLEVDGERLPLRVHRARTPGHAYFAAYFYTHASRPVEHPLRALLADAPRRLVGGARPLALYWVSGTAPSAESEGLERAARRWLRGAWRHHRSVCGA